MKQAWLHELAKLLATQPSFLAGSERKEDSLVAWSNRRRPSCGNHGSQLMAAYLGPKDWDALTRKIQDLRKRQLEDRKETKVNADYMHQLAIPECVIYMAQFSAAGRID